MYITKIYINIYKICVFIFQLPFIFQSVYAVEEKEHLEERLYFKKFETKYVDEGLRFIKENLLSYGSDKSNKVLHATGNLVLSFHFECYSYNL